MKKMFRSICRSKWFMLITIVLVAILCPPAAMFGLPGMPVVFGVSNAFAGVGTKFQRKSGGSYSSIAEVNDIKGPTKKRDTADVTSLDSTGGYREFIGLFRDSGELTLTMNFTRSGYIDMNADFESSELADYQIVFPDTEETTFQFSGFVSSISMSVPTADKVTADVTIKISGVVTLLS